MSPRLRFRLQLLGLLASIAVTVAAAVSMAHVARRVDVVGLAGGAFAAGASVVKLITDRRRGALRAERDAAARPAPR